MSPSYFNSNHTGLCQTSEMMWKMGNLTASYAGEGSRELTMMIAAPAVVLVLVALFLGGIFNLDAVLDPKHRLLLSSALALSLPVMSYLFKDAVGEGASDLPARAGVILPWMLALELLRKKLDEIRERDSYAGAIQRAGRVAWLGSLVYYNITSAGRKAVFSILWILCSTKLVQRIVFTEVEKRSYPDKSWIISSYMGRLMSKDQKDRSLRAEGDGILRMCKYIVMGEEKLVKKVTADGYELKENTRDGDDNIITVGQVWNVVERRLLFGLSDRYQSIKRACLSFALFKLLRGRFEHLPEPTSEEAHYCRWLLMEGLPSASLEDETVLFQVMADEVTFLAEYYHSVVPFVLASPSFILGNYLLVPIVVLVLCLIAIAACGHGDVGYVFHRMRADNYALQPGFTKLVICSLVRAAHSRPAFFFILDLSISTLLFGIFFFQETWELLVLLNSN
nr:unnamed protein product [Digitaria exilis]